MKITLNAPAKINLYLDVVSKRPDGYHDIESIMHTVSLYDLVSVELCDKGVHLSCNYPHVPTDDKNIAFKIAKEFLDHIGSNRGVSIRIDKHIPVSSGLAGGSTDAAATLKALNSILGEPMNINELIDFGARFGADIPFCITGGCAKCEGLGEKLTALPSVKSQKVLVVRGGEGVSTPKAYAMIDELYGDRVNTPHASFDKAVEAVQRGSVSGIVENAYNIFEDVILDKHSIASSIKKCLIEHKAQLAMMSGSGPAVFAFFNDSTSISNAATAVRKLGARAFICETV